MINVTEIGQTTQLKKKSNGVNLFNLMKSELNKNPSLRKFELNFEGIKTVSPFVFIEMFRNMRIRLNGEFVVEIKNANQLIIATYNAVVQGKIN